MALASIVLFTALVPGHLVSQAAAFVGGDAEELVVEMACHSGTAMAGAPNPDGSGTPQEDCPFCEGYAAFMSALPGAPDAGAIDAERARSVGGAMDAGAVQHFATQTNSRDPPHSL